MKDAVEIDQLLRMNGRDLLHLVKQREDKPEIIGRIWTTSQNRDEAKSTQKLAKKALYVLRSGGVDVDSHRPARKSVVSETGQEAVESALLSIPDGLGFSQLVIAMINESSAALTLYRFVMHSIHGVNQFSTTAGSRKLLHKLEEDRFHVSIPTEYALYRLNRVLESTDLQKVSGLSALPGQLMMNKEPVEHPVYAEAGSRLNRIRKPAEDRELFSQEEIGGMTLLPEDIAAFRDEITKARESRLVVQGKTPEERVRDVMQRFYKNYFTRERLEDLSLRLLDTALAYHHRGMQEFAKQLIDYAEGLLSPHLAPDKHPLLGFLTYKAIMSR